MDAITITIDARLLKMLTELNKAGFARIAYTSEVKLPKKLGICGKVEKQAYGLVQLYYNYGSAVNRHLANAGLPTTFVAEPLPWGHWVLNDRLIEHRGQLYLRYYVIRKCPLRHTYSVNGRPATEDEAALIDAYTKHRGSSRQSDAGLSEGEQVFAKCVNIANITRLVTAGMTYEPATEEVAAAMVAK